MERSIPLLLKQDSLSQSVNFYSLLCNLLQVAASTVQFFLVPYFALTLKLSVVQSGLLLSSYGLGVLAATYFKVSSHEPKMQVYALFCNILSLGNFLILTSFEPLIFNVVLLGFGSALFKKNLSHSTYPQTKSLYWSSEMGLALALVGILIFPIVDFKVGIFTAFMLSGLSLFFSFITSQRLSVTDAPEGADYEAMKVVNRRRCHPRQGHQAAVGGPVKNWFRNWAAGFRPRLTESFYLSLLFLGGLLLSQLTTTYGLYLVTQFPDWGLKALAIFMLIHAFILCFLQKPIVFVFHRSDPLFRSGYGALLLGLGCFAFNLGHVFTVVVLSAMVYSLGEIFFIGALYKVCQKNKAVSYFTKTLTGSLIIGASLGAYVYQYFGPRILWQACALLGVLCFIVGIVGMCLKNRDSN